MCRRHLEPTSARTTPMTKALGYYAQQTSAPESLLDNASAFARPFLSPKEIPRMESSRSTYIGESSLPIGGTSVLDAPGGLHLVSWSPQFCLSTSTEVATQTNGRTERKVRTTNLKESMLFEGMKREREGNVEYTE